jgi:hypothetical protein
LTDRSVTRSAPLSRKIAQGQSVTESCLDATAADRVQFVREVCAHYICSV